MPDAVTPIRSNRRATPGKRAISVSTVTVSSPSSSPISAAAVAAHVVEEADRGAVADQRAVGLARLGDDRAVGRPGKKAAGGALTDAGRATDHGRRPPRLAHEPRDHAGDRALAAGAGDGHARLAGVDDLGQQRRTRDAREPEGGGGLHLRCGYLHGGRVNETSDAARDLAAVERQDDA